MKPQPTNNLLLVPSIIDRLLSPDESTGIFRSRNNALNEIKESVRRDLEALLNTRQRCGEQSMVADELSGTVAYYGIPDFTGASFATDVEREQLRQQIELIVKQFEPRFKRVKVTEVKAASNEDRAVRYRIEADLRVEPVVKPVVFDSTVDAVTRKLNIEGANGG